MGLAFYCFGHDIALRLASGQAFALKNAELGASFGQEVPPACFLRGNFTPNSFRGLMAQGVIPPDLIVQDLKQPVAVQMDLLPELAAIHGASIESLNRIGLRIDQNSLTDEVARRLLLFEVWNFTAVTPVEPVQEASPAASRLPAQVAAIFDLFATADDELAPDSIASTEAATPPPATSSTTTHDAVMAFFADEQWPWEAITTTGEALRSVYDGENGSWLCYTRILSELDQVLFYSVCPIAVPPVVVPSMMEFLNRVNTELAFGNFEIDFDTNSVRLRTSLDFKNVGLSPSMLRNVVLQNLAIMDSFLPSILSVVALRESAMSVG